MLVTFWIKKVADDKCTCDHAATENFNMNNIWIV